jgi:membrane-bound serine protease (ClpP class)
MLKILLILFCAYLLFEFIEHLLLPLLGLARKSKKSPSGQTGMIGEVAEVKEWEGTKGRVFVHGELWQAESDTPLEPGDEAVVLSVEGLKLKVKPRED